MAASLNPYPAYKDSGVEWLGQVPEHWEVRRLRNAVDMRVSSVDKHTAEGEPPVRLCNYVDVYKNERITDGIPFMKATASADEIKRFRLNYGDVLITKDSESWNDIGVPALVEYAASDLVCGYHLAMLRPHQRELDGGYLLRVMQSPGIAYQLHTEANGVTRFGLSHAAIKSVWIPYPSASEQTAIARYLDYMNRRIGRYIRAKQKLIKLLEEQKQAMIHQAVTGRIDVRTGKPYPAHRNVATDWLEAVPSGWQVRRLKTVCSMKSGENITSTLIDTTGAYPVYGGNGLRGYTTNYTHEGSYVLVGRQGALCGNVHTVHGRFWASDHAVVVAPRDDYSLAWFGALLTAMNLNQYSVAAAQPGLSVERVSNLSAPIPPPNVQCAVEEFLTAATLGIEQAIQRTRREIDLLVEYRTRLVADVVTGKLDVREAAAQLPDESDEVEPNDNPEALVEDEQPDGEGDLSATREEVEA